MTLTEELAIESPKILRTASDGCWEIYDGPWGKYLRPTFDPEANAEITKEHLNHFEIKENIHRIPANLWTKWVKLCFYFVDKVEECVEVSMRILRSETDPSKYRFLIPKQKVSGAFVRVDSFDKSIDIDTGEEIEQYPPEGWIPVGSSHSHNTMNAFFSGTDDKYELGDPGIHIVVGSIRPKELKYEIAASVVGNGRRFIVSYEQLIDATPVSNQEFNQKVLEYVDYKTPVKLFSTKSNFQKNTSTKLLEKKSESLKSNFNDLSNWGWDESFDADFSDPFYWNNVYDLPTKTKIWNVIDIAKDYVEENRTNIEALKSLEKELYDFLSDISILMEDCPTSC